MASSHDHANVLEQKKIYTYEKSLNSHKIGLVHQHCCCEICKNHSIPGQSVVWMPPQALQDTTSPEILVLILFSLMKMIILKIAIISFSILYSEILKQLHSVWKKSISRYRQICRNGIFSDNVHKH